MEPHRSRFKTLLGIKIPVFPEISLKLQKIEIFQIQMIMQKAWKDLAEFQLILFQTRYLYLKLHQNFGSITFIIKTHLTKPK